MSLITQSLIDAVWLEVEPEASVAFDRIAADHGKAFAEALRDQVLGAKLIEANEAAISSAAKLNSLQN